MKKYLFIIPVIALVFGSNFFLENNNEAISIDNSSVYTYNLNAKKKCSFCHNNIINYKFVHEPVPNECEKCHISTGKKHPRARYKGFNLAAKSADLCYTCHEPNNKQEIHMPVEKGKCNSCHQPHGSQYDNLLIKPTSSELCSKCHNMEPDERKNIHPVIETDGCESCHDPHQSDYSYLLKEKESILCISCHEDMLIEKQPEYIHEPFKNECSGCHDAHSSKENTLLHSSSPDLCFSCHKDLKTKLKKSKFTHKVAGNKFSCEKCHFPHASPNKKLLIKEENDLCFSCHNEKIITESGTIDNMKRKIKNSKFIHEPISEEGCNSCHDPHASNNQDLLTNKFPAEMYAEGTTETFELCFNCHNKELLEKETSKTATNFRNQEINLHYVHLNGTKGRNCNICHDVHASNNEFLLKKKTKFGNWNMPIKFVLKENGASCKTGCHEEKEYIRSVENIEELKTDSINNKESE